MKEKQLKRFFENYGILIVSIAFVVVVKIPHLTLPYSWDEAWSYLPALIEMVEKGPSLISGSIHLFSSKGHPLLFYFLSSSWITIFSAKTSDIELVRLFQLLVSIVLLVCLFFVAKKHSSLKVANFSVAVLSVQTLFLAQASLILPEMLLALLLLLSIHFFVLNKFGWYALSAALMVLTKETGLIFAGGFGLFFLMENRSDIFKKDVILKLILLSIPLIIFGIHLLLNFKTYHTYFFTEHLDYISFDPKKVSRVLKSATGILFTMHGRNVISAIAIISFIVILVRKEKIGNGKLLLLIIFQIVLLTAFTSVNFYTYRYMLPAFPVFIMLSLILTNQGFSKYKYMFKVFVALMISSTLFYSFTKRGTTDIDLGYTVYLPIHKEMVVYCENQNWFDKNYAAEFNMVLALRDPFTGYHNSGKGFNTHLLPSLENTDVVILDSTGEWKELPENEKENFRLIKRFENKNHWGEIYLRK